MIMLQRTTLEEIYI